MPETVEFGTNLDVEIQGSLSLGKFKGRFPSPWTRILFVDNDGTGDYETIGEAIAAAEAAGASAAAWLRWTIVIMPGVYEESFTVPDGVDLMAWAPMGVRVNGQVVQKPWSTIYGLYIAAPNDANWALHLDQTGLTSASARPRLVSCYIINNQSAGVDGDVESIRITGGTSPSPIIYGLRNCTLYSANRYSGSGTDARMQCIHAMPGSHVAIEAFGGMHYKTSSGASGTVLSPTVFLNESTGYAYLHSDGTWNCEYANDPATPPMYVRSASTITKGGLINIAFFGEAGIVPSSETAYTTDQDFYFSHTVDRLTARHLVVSEGADLPWMWRFAPSSSYGPTYAGAKASTSLTAGTMRAAPFEVRTTQRFVSMGLRISAGAASAVIRLMVFADDGYGRPGALVVDAGTQDASATVSATKTIDITLAPGLYHLAVGASGGSPSVFMYTGAAPNVPQSGAGDSTVNAGRSGTYSGTAPADFGTATVATHAPFITMTTAA